MSRLFEHIDAYCERTDASFWSEPINAVTNAAFIIAALFLFRLWQNSERRWADLVLILVITAIGIGSFLFHTFATVWAALADVIPIAIFIHVYFFLAMRRFFGLGVLLSLAITLGFFVAGYGVRPFLSPYLGGSAGYVPALCAMAVISVLLYRLGKPEWAGIATAFVLFLFSLSLRTVDMAACDAFPIGTHFFWHILNAVVLGVLARTMIARNTNSTDLAGQPRGL